VAVTSPVFARLSDGDIYISGAPFILPIHQTVCKMDKKLMKIFKKNVFIFLLGAMLANQIYAMDKQQSSDAEIVFCIKLAEQKTVYPVCISIFRYYLNGNKTSLGSEEIGKREGLKYVLLLNGYDLVSLPEEIGSLIKLTEINLLNNSLTTIPSEIEKLLHLTKLNVSINNITIFPSCVGNLSSLTSLDLSHNKLKQIPAEIGNLQSLTQLDLTYNELMSFPSELGNLPRIKEMRFYHNNLTSIPLEIGRLETLQLLVLSSNQLTKLPHQIGDLVNLSYLDLESNQITSLPFTIFYMGALKKIHLSDNLLPMHREWPNTLQGNNLSHFKFYNRFVFLVMLPYLYDSNCSLTVLPKDIMAIIFLMYDDDLSGEIKNPCLS
jgi:hypothetical protein